MSLSVDLSIFLTGLCFAWSSPILVKLAETKDNPLGDPITPDESDLIGSLFYIGCCIGPIFIIWILVKFGRKTSLIISIVPFILAHVCFAFSKNIEVYYICRIISGIAVGSIVSAVPVYTSEILPPKIRGCLMSLCNTFIQAGSLLSYVSGPYLSVCYFNIMIVIVSLVFLILFVIFCPESPYYTLVANGKEETGKLLRHLRVENINYELNEIEAALSEQRNDSFLAIFKTKSNVKAFLLATILLVIQQFTGTNIIMGYSQLIFLETNVIFSSDKCAIIVGCFQLFSSFLTPLYSEKYPRKSLLGFSLSGLIICNFTMSIYFFVLKDMNIMNWLPLLALAVFVLFDNCGDGALPWVLLGELYPSHIKCTGSSLSTSIFYLVQFCLTFIFHKVELKFMFLGFGCLTILALIFIYYFVPETKGKTLREIQELIEKDSIFA